MVPATWVPVRQGLGVKPAAPAREELTRLAGLLPVGVRARDNLEKTFESAGRREAVPYPNSIPWASGRSVLQFTVLVWRRMYAFHASDPDSRPPPVSFSPPKAPPISAPEVPMLTLAIPQSLPRCDRKCSASRT